jgi:hypothetical protein
MSIAMSLRKDMNIKHVCLLKKVDLNDFQQKREEHLTLLKTTLCYEASIKVEHGLLSLI